MAKINELSTVSGNNEWYVVYDDSDSITDYFHSYRGSQKRMAELITEDGADIIEVNLQNGHTVEEKDIKAVQRLAKKTGYKFELKHEEKTNYAGEKWNHTYGILTKEVKK
jgi:hypothetical protein